MPHAYLNICPGNVGNHLITLLLPSRNLCPPQSPDEKSFPRILPDLRLADACSKRATMGPGSGADFPNPIDFGSGYNFENQLTARLIAAHGRQLSKRRALPCASCHQQPYTDHDLSHGSTPTMQCTALHLA
jgi:hypothetical protein